MPPALLYCDKRRVPTVAKHEDGLMKAHISSSRMSLRDVYELTNGRWTSLPRLNVILDACKFVMHTRSVLSALWCTQGSDPTGNI